jgi:TPR repeat protein
VLTASRADEPVAALPAPEAPSSPAVDTPSLSADAPSNATEAPSAPAAAQPQGGARDIAAPRPSQDLSEIEQIMMDRGGTYWKEGDVAAARLLYRPLAKKGIAAAALAMARTYDPEALAAIAVHGLQPDLAQAKHWYRMAEELGSTQAAQRLAALDGQAN